MPTEGTNLAVVVGHLSSPPRRKDLPSASELVTLEVTVSREGSPAASVPVCVFDPPRRVAALDAGDAVAVVGDVRRRFFRAGGATVSRTEVLARRVVPGARRAEVRRLLAAAADELSAGM